MSVADEVAGERIAHEGFTSAFLGNSRTITVALPPGYSAAPRRRYPVLYLHDGQNLFDPARAAFGVSWGADATANRLMAARRIRPVTLVGIDNTPERVDEYTYHRDARHKAGGRGSLYARFVLNEVKPFIDRQYRTLPERENTGLLGSSLGGLVSLCMAREYPNRIGLCGVVSPSLWWAGSKVLVELEGDDLRWMKKVRFWLDMGTREGRRRGHLPSAIDQARRLAGQFDRAGLVPGRDYYYQEVAGGEHHEAAWAARFDKILLYFYGL
jgi:predicted alpha/beta superfamily hydrolase